jgi:hypothetical protein
MEKTSADDSTMWVPICCGQVMRHRMLPGPGGAAAAATLGCGTCGKHITLGPEPAAALKEYGEGSLLIRLLGTPRAASPKSAAATAAAHLDDETRA